MPDYGSQVADNAISATAWKVDRVYRQAAKELQAKFKDFNKKHKAKEKELRKKVKDGLMTQEQFDSWMTGQVFIGKQWQDKVDQAIKIMNDANNQAVRIVDKGKINVFAENYNYSAYQLERKAKGVVSFNLYNEETVGRLIKDKPEMLPKWKIDQKKDYIWNRRKVENSITQGIIQGEGIDQITNRLIDNLCAQNDSKMKTFARTAITGAQNAGRQKQAEDAEEMGIKVKKKWIATLDDRTRDTHQELDGQEVDVDEPFKVRVDGVLEEIDYPGDPSALPCLVYNCRCSMIQVYPGIDRQGKRRAYYDEDDNEYEEGKRNSYEVDSNLTYKEWKAQKEGKQTTEEKQTIGGAVKVNGAVVTEKVEYGELFTEKQSVATREALAECYREDPLQEPLEFVGDVRIYRGIGLDEDIIDLHDNHPELVPCTAQYLGPGNSRMPPHIEVHQETLSTIPLNEEFDMRYQLRLKYPEVTEATAFNVVSDSVQGTIRHEYAHALADSYGLFGTPRTPEEKEFNDWLWKFWETHQEELLHISKYARSHPAEMLAECYVQVADTAHTDTIAYKTAETVIKKFKATIRRIKK